MQEWVKPRYRQAASRQQTILVMSGCATDLTVLAVLAVFSTIIACGECEVDTRSSTDGPCVECEVTDLLVIIIMGILFFL